MSLTRRRFLTNTGIVLWLPVLESLVPEKVFAAAQARNKFIGVFTPSGMHMSFQNNVTSNGNWTFDNALKPIVDAGHRNNIMILRGLHSTYPQDPHWQNTAGFLSCVPITLGPTRPVICGKSFDQYIADQFPTPLRTMHVGWKPNIRDFSGDHAEYSDRYMDTIAWRAPDRPIANTYSVNGVYEAIFTANSRGSAHLRAQNARKKSLLDFVLTDLRNVRRTLTSDDRARLESYTEGVRELETKVAKVANGEGAHSCTADNPGPQATYESHLQVLQALMVQAISCDIISGGTIMYDDGVGDAYLRHPNAQVDHHHYAHLVDGASNIPVLEGINRRHGGFFANLVTELKNRGQIDRTLALWGSNMSDGTVHSTDNLPFVLAGAGSDLKFGQEVGVNTDRVAKADLFVELAQVYGMTSIQSFGSDSLASTGKRRGIRV